jgi:hypothetical protein
MDVEQFDVLCRTVAGAQEEVEDEEADTWQFTAGELSVRLDRTELRRLYHLLAGAESMRVLRESLHAVADGRLRDRVAPR